MIHVLYLDRYHLGDPLFLSGFARDVLAFAAPLVIVHGAGEAAERALEAQGRIVTFEDGVLAAETDAERGVVVRAARDLNRQIAHALNDAGVASVGLEASGRGLVRATSEGIEAGKGDWLGDLVEQGAVPVVAALLTGEEGEMREANGGAVAGTIVHALGEAGRSARVVVLTQSGQNGIKMGDLTQREADADSLSGGALVEPEAARAALSAGADVLVTGRSGLRRKPPEGTLISAASQS